MEVLEQSSDVVAGLVGDQPGRGDPGGLQGLDSQALDQARSLEVFAEKQRPSIVVAEALRCQVKITTRRSLHLRIANHTARDIYVRLVGQGGCIAGTTVGVERHILEQSAVAVKEPASLSPLKPSASSVDTEQQSTESPAPANNHQPPLSTETSNLRPQMPQAEDEAEEDESSGALTISELIYSPCASMLPTPVEDSQGGVDLFFSSPIQSPARLLRELHADPDIQAQLEAERERDRANERTRLAASRSVGGVLTNSLRLLSSNERVNSCLLSVARLVAVVMGVLLVTVPTLLLLLESDIDVSFLHEIRQTPEFEQFHYEYYCPLRRWILCRFSIIMESLWSD